MTTVFIMAQGQQQRIGHLLTGPKQLIGIQGEETVFERTVRLVREVDGGARVVAVVHADGAWVDATSRAGCEMYIQPDPGSSVVGAIRNVEFMWGDRTVVLLGDVVFSKAAIRTILGPGTMRAFFGRLGGNQVTGKTFAELFGLAFGDASGIELLQHTSDAGWSHHQDTKLWGLLERTGWPVLPIGDYTDDLDTEEDYVKRLPILRGAVAADVG